MRFLFPIIALLFFTISNIYSQAQNNSPCGLNNAMQELYEKNPELIQTNKENLNSLISELDNIITQKKGKKQSNEPLEIPVVFHVFYDECETVNDVLANYRFDNAIDKLNADFSGLTSGVLDDDGELVSCAENCCISYGETGPSSSCTDNPCSASYCELKGESRIRFKLAQKDPDGYPTTGVNRIKSGMTNQALANEKDLKKKIMWARGEYLNIYVVKLATSGEHSGLAHYPTTSHVSEITNPANVDNQYYDGPVMANWAIDPDLNGDDANYDYILSHEVGHWLGLRHIWGGSNANNSCSNCGDDDFDFINNKFLTEYASLLGLDPLNTETWDSFDDTPNTIGRNIKDSNCFIRNTCPDSIAVDNAIEYPLDPNDVCGLYTYSDPLKEIVDMDDNFMDYSPCAQMFTKGQVSFMELVLQSPLAERNGLISEATHDKVFYENEDEPRVLFKDYICYEDFSNQGNIFQVLEINLVDSYFAFNPINALDNENLISDITDNNPSTNPPPPVPAAYYPKPANFPTGINMALYVVPDGNNSSQSTRAKLIIHGQTGTNQPHDTDVDVSIVMDKNLFVNPSITNFSIAEINRTKVIEFDFIEDIGVVYTDIESYAGAGPNSLEYQTFDVTVNELSTNVFVWYEVDSDNTNILQNFKMEIKPEFQLELDSNGKIKRFSKNEQITTDNLSSATDIAQYYFDSSSFSTTTVADFYIGFKFDCVPYTGWMRLKYDPSCTTLSAIDYGFLINENTNVNAGEVSEPVLVYTPKVISKNDGTFSGFSIELLQTDAAETIAINIADFATIEEVNDEGMPVTNPLGLTIGDLDISVNSATSITVDANLTDNPTNNFWVNNPEANLKFKLEFGDGVSTIFNYASDPIVKVSQPISIYNLVETDETAEPIIDNFGSLTTPFGLPTPHPFYIGLTYYEDALNTDDNGYILFTEQGAHFEALCIPGSEELDLVSFYTEVSDVNDGDFKTVRDAKLTSDNGITNGQLYITGETVDMYAGQEKYILYRIHYDCKEYYGWLKILFNENGSITVLETAYESDPDKYIAAGYLPPIDCSPAEIVNTNYLYINNFYMQSVDFNNVQVGTSAASGYTDYSDIPIYIDLGSTSSLAFEIHQNVDSPELGDWYIWIDFNQNDIFEKEELVFHTPETNVATGNLNLPSTLFGQYRMRVVCSLHVLDPDGEPQSGCTEFSYGETEDYLLDLTSSCQNQLTISQTIPEGEYQAGGYIQVDNNAYLKATHKSTLVAENYIEILPNTLIEKHSVFEVRIEDCTNTPALLVDYPWLNGLVNLDDCCPGATVTEYTIGAYYYLLVSGTGCEGSTNNDGLYLNWANNGSLVCSNGDCIATYQPLGISGPGRSWTCGGTIAKMDDNSNDVLSTIGSYVSFSIAPNPFDNVFTLKYEVVELAPITIDLYDLDGKLVKSIMENEVHKSGAYSKSIDGTDLPNGVYLVKLNNGEEQQVKRLVKIK